VNADRLELVDLDHDPGEWSSGTPGVSPRASDETV
jgi:hypothetical protein